MKCGWYEDEKAGAGGGFFFSLVIDSKVDALIPGDILDALLPGSSFILLLPCGLSCKQTRPPRMECVSIHNTRLTQCHKCANTLKLKNIILIHLIQDENNIPRTSIVKNLLCICSFLRCC